MSVFLDCRKLSLPIKLEILEEAKIKSFRWWVDELRDSMCRQRIEMSWEEITRKLDDSSHFTCVYRSIKDITTQKSYGEAGFVTRDDYFLWILIETDKFQEIMDKFDLKVRLC